MVEMILPHYQLQNVRAIERMTTGLIHETYKVEAFRGYFILQKVHPIFGKAMLEDVDAVSQELIRQGMTAQTVVRTKNGGLYVEHDGELWRLLTYIPGEVFETVREPNIAYEAGKMLGSFHRALDGFNYEFKHARPLHHNTREHLRLLRVAASADREVDELVEFVIEKLQSLFLPEQLRKTITQGDPKITNFIFQNQKAVALIDIDDVGRQHNVLVELGDAFRSWCSRGEGDDDNKLDIAFFEAGMRGYQEGSYNFLLKEESALLPQAIQLINLELAARFLRDYFEDNYFGWDASRYPSRKAHNLARAKGQIRLYHSIVEQNDDLGVVIHSSA